jgi:hypothetical protein
LSNRELWFGLLGAVLGAILSAVCQPLFERWLRGPEEGIFDVNVNAVRSSDLDDEVRRQVARYPIVVEVRHVEGPAARGITVLLESKIALSGVLCTRQDDPTTIVTRDNSKTVVISVPELRKKATNKYRILSEGSPDFQYSVQMTAGQVLSDVKPEPKRWYENEAFVSVAVITGILVAILGFTICGSIVFQLPMGKAFNWKIALLVFGAFATSMLPLPLLGSIIVIVPLLLMAGISARLRSLDDRLGAIEPKQ